MREIFQFPRTVNDVAARTVATGVVLIAAVAIAFHEPWLTIVLAYGFLARVASGPRFSPLALVATRVVAPQLLKFEKIVPGPPKRFAQGIGLLFTSTALVLWLAGATTASLVVLALLLPPAILEAAFGYCVGCKVFAFLIRHGVLPESVCEECNDIWSRVR